MENFELIDSRKRVPALIFPQFPLFQINCVTLSLLSSDFASLLECHGANKTLLEN